MTGSANRARLVLFGALLLAGFCLWQLAEAASEFFADKALAEQKYTRCLEKIERQAAIEKIRRRDEAKFGLAGTNSLPLSSTRKMARCSCH